RLPRRRSRRDRRGAPRRLVARGEATGRGRAPRARARPARARPLRPPRRWLGTGGGAVRRGELRSRLAARDRDIPVAINGAATPRAQVQRGSCFGAFRAALPAYAPSVDGGSD